ncbi:MAG: M28 family metallopeptidase [Chloroflexota bacterium]
MACNLLQGPPQPVIPTPPPLPAAPTAVLLSPVAVLPENVVFNPVSNVVPSVDPVIRALLDEVSNQQLVAYVQALESFGTRHTLSVTDRADFGVGAARSWLYDEFVRVGNGRLQVEVDSFALTLNGITTEQQNIVATLPGNGSNPGAVLLVAHYDSRPIDAYDGSSQAPGANDNGSGVAAMLEIARLLSTQEWNMNVVFIAFAAEEQGTHGSLHFVTDRFVQQMGVTAVFDNDIVGGRPGIPQLIRVFSQGPDTSPARQVVRYLDLVGGLYVPQFGVSVIDAIDRPGRYSDHMRFADVGIAALRLTESIEDPDRQHNARDTSDAIDFTYLRQVTQLNLAAIANIIGAPPIPESPAISPLATAGEYLFSWTVAPDAAGYVISLRPVGSDVFAPFRFVRAEEAGEVVITGLDPTITYAVSLAALAENGRISLFSPEITVGP